MKLKFVIAMLLGFIVTTQFTFAQQTSSSDNKTTATDTENSKKELRLKACGTEKVNYDASTDKKQHPTPAASADKALIYVYRSTILGYKIHSKLAVDGKWMGVNRGKTYFFFALEPGEHFFCSESENQDYLALTVEAGKTYYLQQEVKAGVWKARTHLRIADELQAKKKIEDLNLSVFTEKK